MSAGSTPPAIHLVPATSADADMLEAMVADFHAEEGVQQDQVTRRKAIDELLANPHYGQALLIRNAIGQTETIFGYAVLGFGYSLEFAGRDGFLDEIFIKPAHRGKGLGTQALKQASTWARQNGLKALHLEVARNNPAAKALYERLGFADREHYHLMSHTFDRRS